MKNPLKTLLVLTLTPLYLAAIEGSSSSIETLTKRINKYGKLGELYHKRAQLHMQNGDFDKAYIDVEKAIIIAPEMQEPKLLQAKLYLEKEQNEKAIISLNTFIKSTTNKDLLMKAHFLLGDALMSSSKYEEATVHYKSMQNKNFSFKQKHYIKIADAHYRLGDYKKSIKVLKGALATLIKKDTLREKIVELSMEEGNYSLAMSMLNSMIVNEKHNAQLFYLRARVLKEQGRLKDMKDEIEKAQLAMKNDAKQNPKKKQLTGKIKRLLASL